MTENGNRPSQVSQPELDYIDSAWDDDLSGEIPLDFAPESQGDRVTVIPELPPSEYVRRAMAAAEDPHQEEKSGVQPKEERPSKRPTPTAGLELDLPPGVVPDVPSFSHPELELTIDDPVSHAARPPAPSFDDLSLELHADSDAEPLYVAQPARELELDGTPAAAPVEDLALVKMRDRYAAGDFTGALILAESLLETEPDHEEAARYARSCRDVLTQMYAARLGPLDQVVTIAVPPDQVRWLSLDHRSGFLLSLVDGSSSIEEILDISGMSRLDALRLLYTLLEQQIVSLSGGSV